MPPPKRIASCKKYLTDNGMTVTERYKSPKKSKTTWEYYIENGHNGAEHLDRVNTITEAKERSRNSVQITYDVDREYSTDPVTMPTVPQPKIYKKKKVAWNIYKDVFYRMPPYNTKRNIVLLACYQNGTEYIIRSGKEDEVFK